jgi:hypothetical protein
MGNTGQQGKLLIRIAYQFKITLIGVQPLIWRRIQVTDCTLDKLHEHIQTAMGWTNSHLHQFEIAGRIYGDPQLLDDGFGEVAFNDSVTTYLRPLLGRRKKGFCFRYEYDFGDAWQHEVQLEDLLPPDPGTAYPRCLGGARACPPEDCGGVSGYARLLTLLANPNHRDHRDLSQWVGPFDPEAFDPQAATAAMHEGIFDWRNAEDSW